jgi:hypothetical protein
MNHHAQQVADLETLTADYFAGAHLPQGRRVGGRPVAYELLWLHDIKIASIINDGAFNGVSPALAYAQAVGRPISPAEWGHGFIQALDRDWPRLPTLEMKIARLRAFHKDLEIAW